MRDLGIVAAVALQCGGCGFPADDAHATAVVRDSAGVTIVESAQRAWDADVGLAIGEVVRTIGGGPDGDLFDVVGAALLSDGAITLADGGSGQVRIYDAEGWRTATFGRSGDGPGEFRLLQSMGTAPGDTLWVYDYSAGKVALLTPSGGVVSTHILEPRLSAPVVVGRRSDGGWIVAEMWGRGDPSRPRTEGLARDPAAYVLYSADGVLLDTLGLFPGREVLLGQEEGRVTMGSPPFGRVSSHTLLGDDLVVGDQTDHEVAIYGASRTPRRIVRWAGAELALEADDVAAWKEEQVAAEPSARRASVRAYLAEVPVPERRPAYGRLLSDAHGRLWAEGMGSWTVLGEDGRWLGDVAVPDGFRLLQVGNDRAVGVMEDAYGVETVQIRVLHDRRQPM